MYVGHNFQGIEENLAKLYFYHNKKVLEHPLILNVFNESPFNNTPKISTHSK